MHASEVFIIFCVTVPLLLYKLQNLLNYESKAPVRDAIDQLQFIGTRLRDMNTSGRLWRKFLRELHDLEDVIDNLIGEIELQRRNDSLKIMSPLICLRPQRDRIRLIGQKLKMVTDTATLFRNRLILTTDTTIYDSDFHLIYDSDFVALNDTVDEVVKLLRDGEMPNTIVVSGGPGSCETFLKKKVYNATAVKRHFHGRAWVNFSADFESREFLIDILTQLTWDWEFLDENLSYEELKLKLLNFSSNKRCLIVVDDFPTLEYFNRLFDVCGLSSKGIWLMLIGFMKDEELASLEVKPCFCHLIRLRSRTGRLRRTSIWKKATTETRGRLLSPPRRSSVIEHEILEKTLNSCYDDLPSRMKVCFLYFRLFPRAFEIPVRRLFHLWVAEGLFITLPDEENMAPEDLAEECLKLLIRKNLIEVTKVRLDGSPKTCRMPTTIWDVFSPAAKVLGHSHDHNKIYLCGRDDHHGQSDIRRLTNYAANGIDPQFYRHIQHLRSYVSFNTESSGKFLDALVTPGGFGLLVVLDLENVYKPAMLTETLGKLLHLKHLGLRRTFLDSLPRSVGNLPYLETLDVKHTNVTSLPSSIWKAKKLQHLYLNENNFDMSFKKTYIGSDSEIILQTLSGLFIGNKNVVKSYLYSLRRLRKLKLTFYSKSVEGIASWISELRALRSLKLRSIDEFDRPATLELGSLETHHELLELYLVGPLTRSIESLCSPSLRVLTLSASKLGEDPMPVLGKLPHLNCLRLFRNSYLGKEMTCAEEFPQLRVLKLWMLENLEEWTVIEGTMPLLRELEIRLCPKLNQPVKLPLTLKDVVLINMPDGFAEYVERVLVNSFVKKITLPFAALPE